MCLMMFKKVYRMSEGGACLFTLKNRLVKPLKFRGDSDASRMDTHFVEGRRLLEWL
uniref:Uncharacterized protein n=1 Tax=Anguilla anguilla TaxID=7936 RepID=A0A0E9XGA2_ANGAN